MFFDGPVVRTTREKACVFVYARVMAQHSKRDLTPFEWCMPYEYVQASAAWGIAEWLERLTANVEVATVLGSIPASSDTVESEGRQMKQFEESTEKKYPPL